MYYRIKNLTNFRYTQLNKAKILSVTKSLKTINVNLERTFFTAFMLSYLEVKSEL